MSHSSGLKFLIIGFAGLNLVLRCAKSLRLLSGPPDKCQISASHYDTAFASSLPVHCSLTLIRCRRGMSLLSRHRAEKLYRLENMYQPGRTATAAVLRTI
jgi:hypothetical protein